VHLGGRRGMHPRETSRGSCLAKLSPHVACSHQTEPTWARPAGYETTANAITFTVYLLARNPGGHASSAVLCQPLVGIRHG